MTSAQVYYVTEINCLEICGLGLSACLHFFFFTDVPQCPFTPPQSQFVQKEKNIALKADTCTLTKNPPTVNRQNSQQHTKSRINSESDFPWWSHLFLWTWSSRIDPEMVEWFEWPALHDKSLEHSHKQYVRNFTFILLKPDFWKSECLIVWLMMLIMV